MKILFLDTSSFFVTVAILEDDKILFEYKDSILDDMSSKIMPIISQGFDSVAFTINDIDKIFVVNGPGSFTGVRIGVTIAKTIAWAIKKDIITLSSLEYIATTRFDTKFVAPLIDARRGYVFAGIYDKDLNIIKNDSYIKLDELKESLVDTTFISYDEIKNSIKPNTDIIKIIKKHINDEPLLCHVVKPNYLKKTEAEEKLEVKNND